ncbi:hypothetical protein [Thermogemmatispora carboxidivorans]|uniref:hypothetical protein n=1 Tax=Thermogemmatispora carboxidivorans TaxID=1382306 RepID=UPI0012DD6333|nr:hypothetical protein [Thermogemmatispora carboxidivorans]
MRLSHLPPQRPAPPGAPLPIPEERLDQSAALASSAGGSQARHRPSAFGSAPIPIALLFAFARSLALATGTGHWHWPLALAMN